MRTINECFHKPFFRDHNFWRTLEENLLINLAKQKTGQITVWLSYCACGEEIYSFKMIRGLELLAADMNPEYLDRAGKAIYTSSSLKELPDEFKWLFTIEKRCL